MFVLSLMFACEEAVEDGDDNSHRDYYCEGDQCGCARASVKIDDIGVEDRVV